MHALSGPLTNIELLELSSSGKPRFSASVFSRSEDAFAESLVVTVLVTRDLEPDGSVNTSLRLDLLLALVALPLPLPLLAPEPF